MRVETWGLVDHEEKAPNAAQWTSVFVKLTEAEVDDRGGLGFSVGAIDVERADGKTARFFLTVFRTHQGRIQAEIRANRSDDEVAKRVTGVWLDYEARARGEA